MTRRQKAEAALRRLLRAEDGATAVEFAFVAVPFLMLTMAIIELGMVFLASVTLDGATETAARKIRTGEFQTSGSVTPAAFKTLVCGGMTWLSDECQSKLYVDVRRSVTFNDITAPDPVTNGVFNPANTCFNAGGPTDIILARTFLEWTLFTPLLDDSLQNMAGGKRLISSTAVFRNEPYNTSTGTAGCGTSGGGGGGGGGGGPTNG